MPLQVLTKVLKVLTKVLTKVPLEVPIKKLLSLECRAAHTGGPLVLDIKRPRFSGPVPVCPGPGCRLVGDWMPSEMAEQRATCPPAVTLSEYTQPILLSQTLNPQPPRAFYQRPFNRLYASSQFPGTNLCRALTIQSIVTHQWNKDSFIAHNVVIAAAKARSVEQVV